MLHLSVTSSFQLWAPLEDDLLHNNKLRAANSTWPEAFSVDFLILQAPLQAHRVILDPGKRPGT
jgi:hypothetical protein